MHARMKKVGWWGRGRPGCEVDSVQSPSKCIDTKDVFGKRCKNQDGGGRQGVGTGCWGTDTRGTLCAFSILNHYLIT